jgi:hypothetical protein
MVVAMEEQKDSILKNYLSILQNCEFEELLNLYETRATIKSNLLPKIINREDYVNFWRLWLTKEEKKYINTLQINEADNSIRIIVISYSKRFKKIVYLDINSRFEEIHGKIINQHDKVQISTFLAHFLPLFSLILTLIPSYLKKFKRGIYTLIQSN